MDMKKSLVLALKVHAVMVLALALIEGRVLGPGLESLLTSLDEGNSYREVSRSKQDATLSQGL